MIKKIFISFLVLIFISSNILHSYKVSANSNPFAPPAVQGYDEALFTSFMAGVGAITAGAMHTTESINKMRDFAVDNWPALKESFSNALTWTGDQFIIAGDWIEDVLMPSMENSDLNYSDSTGNMTVTNNGQYFYAPKGYNFVVTGINESGDFVRLETGAIRISLGITYSDTYYEVDRPIKMAKVYYTEFPGDTDADKKNALRNKYESIISKLNYAKENPTVSSVRSALSAMGITLTLVTADGLPVEDDGNTIYNQVDNWFRQREAYENGLTLGIPQSAPYTTTGRALQYDDVLGTLTLDGVPYTGEVDWKTLANLGLNIPAIPLWLADLPVFYLGDGVFVDQNGHVIPADKVGDITVGYPDIVIDGTNVYVRTQTGDLVNLKTGEIVTTGDLDVPTVPVVPTIPVEYTGEFATPTTTIDWNPLLMAGRGLTEKFPFSIPFDFYRQLQVFDVQPEAPKFKINVSNYFTIDGHQQSMNWELSFEQFDTIATIFRWFILILFDIGLILAIRRIMPE